MRILAGSVTSLVLGSRFKSGLLEGQFPSEMKSWYNSSQKVDMNSGGCTIQLKCVIGFTQCMDVRQWYSKRIKFRHVRVYFSLTMWLKPSHTTWSLFMHQPVHTAASGEWLLLHSCTQTTSVAVHNRKLQLLEVDCAARWCTIAHCMKHYHVSVAWECRLHRAGHVPPTTQI